MNTKLSVLSVCIAFSLAACGGSGGSSNSTTSTNTADTATNGSIASGRILGLQGIRYKSGATEGYTDENGNFQYEAGNSVSFFVGDIELGSTQGAAELSLADLAGGNATTEENISRFLTTVDYDLAPMNGVFVSESIHDAASGRSLNFNQSKAAFTQAAESVLEGPLASDVHVYALQHGIATILPELAKQKAQRESRILKRFTYPKASAEVKANFPDIESEAEAVFDLMLSNTVTEGQSPLEHIFGATNTQLVLENNEEGSLFDLYVNYKQRVNTIGPDAPVIEREEFASKPAGIANATDVHHFAVMSDFQMRDDESPLNVNPVKFLISSSYYPASPHITYQVDDMVRTMRDYEAANKPIELAVFTGDFTDISQFNEVRIGIDVLDGGIVNPDSGIDDDPIPGNFEDGKPNDTFDSFTALGLNGQGNQADIPWFYIAGNHDGLMLGNFPITDGDLNLFGKTIRNGTRAFYDGIATGSTNWLGYEPSLLGFLQHLLDPSSFHIPPDLDRKVQTPKEIALEMFNTSSTPSGHGMQNVIDQRGSLDGRLHYSFTSNNGLVRHLALDTNMPIGPEGWLDLTDMAWIKKELDAAQAEGQLVIVGSHHKPKDIIINGMLLVATLNEYPNVIAHLVAHSHINTLKPRPGADAAHGYWEIESGSMVNWPQQFRILDIQIDAASGTGVIKSTMLNHKTDSPLHVSQRGRFLAYLERLLEGGTDGLVNAEGEAEDRNANLYFVVPQGVLSRL